MLYIIVFLLSLSFQAVFAMQTLWEAGTKIRGHHPSLDLSDTSIIQSLSSDSRLRSIALIQASTHSIVSYT